MKNQLSYRYFIFFDIIYFSARFYVFFLVVNLHDVINTHKTDFQTQEYFIIAIATSVHDIIVIQNV